MNKPKKELTFEEKVLKELKSINKKLNSLEGENLMLKHGLALLAIHVTDSLPFFSQNVFDSRLYGEYRIFNYLEISPFFTSRKYHPFDDEAKKYQIYASGYVEDMEKFKKYLDDKRKEKTKEGEEIKQ